MATSDESQTLVCTFFRRAPGGGGGGGGGGALPPGTLAEDRGVLRGGGSASPAGFPRFLLDGFGPRPVPARHADVTFSHA